MDGARFDNLLRTLSESPSRRGIARTLAGIALATPLAALCDAPWTAARKKHKRKKHKKNHTSCGECGGSTICQNGQCVCPTACCSNADCGFQGVCESGVCDCKSGARFCAGTCIPENDCCTSEECDTNQTCQDGQCACLATHKECSGACIPRNVCCNGSCAAGEDCLINGSCAKVCGGGDCANGCFCGVGTAEGSFHHCHVTVASCNALPACTSTAQCPVGQVCEQLLCSGTIPETRCVQLCNT
jgi:hypothetical protein